MIHKKKRGFEAIGDCESVAIRIYKEIYTC